MARREEEYATLLRADGREASRVAAVTLPVARLYELETAQQKDASKFMPYREAGNDFVQQEMCNINSYIGLQVSWR